MSTKPAITLQAEQKPKVVYQGSGPDAVYGLGLIGAWVYFFKRAATPEERLRAFFKGLVWPAILIYELFGFLHQE